MNRHSLEQRLRSEPAPDESDHVPRILPASVADASRELEGGRRGGIGRLLVVTVAAAAVVVLAASAWLGAPDASPVGAGASGSAAPSSVADGACGSGDLALAMDRWGGAAGSRGTVVSITLADGVAACDLDRRISASIITIASDGSIAVVSDPLEGVAPGTLRLDGRTQYTIGVSWSNWCGPMPASPLRLELTSGAAEPMVVAAAPGVDGTIPVPPCLGADHSSLSVTEVQSGP